MTSILLILGRLFVILVGFVGAALAASAFINILALGALGAPPGDPVASASLVFTIPFMALFVAYYAFFPAVIAITFTELLGKRDWLTHALCGGGVALTLVGILLSGTWQVDVNEGLEPYWLRLDDPRLVMLLLGAGLLGGIAYWLIAGNSAGSWRSERKTPPTSPAP
ncbi:hypothetical protein G6N74_12830 [Mesorhizobium sp. CGMCC 1.15528]|uniref:Uncharacterized protein n=1 Tax=Mesorhizobium zhangyense TaxID=1776730 RepID=A0A7C9VC97_9HYPH|nr:hypothetical protein [Mesorhizobium zhangyense]NGN41949.1 hypothetical protein [Mesorhizobium zhangyense]